jgi:phage terminase small subunit
LDVARRLTDKQRAFVEAYLETLNGTEAARRANYKGKDATLSAVAYENLRKPHIRERIDERLAEMAMSANEVLARLTKQADPPDVTEFTKLKELYEYDSDGQRYLVGLALTLDLDQIQKLGLGKQIKRLKQTSGGLEIEWYDAQSALIQLGKYHKLFTEKVEHSGSVQQATVNIYIPDNGRGDRD